MSVKEIGNLYDEIMNAEPVAKYKKSAPGRRSETSKANAAKARETKLAQLREKQMFENYVAQKTKQMLDTKKQMNPRDLLESYQSHEISTPRGSQKIPPTKVKKLASMQVNEEDYDEDYSDSESEDEVIYVAQAPRIKQTGKGTNPGGKGANPQSGEIEELKKQLEELKMKPTVPLEVIPKVESVATPIVETNPYKYIRTEPQRKANDEIIDTMRKKLINF